jgi:hypothetical protein
MIGGLGVLPRNIFCFQGTNAAFEQHFMNKMELLLMDEKQWLIN